MRAVTRKLIVGSESMRNPISITAWNFPVVFCSLVLILGFCLSVQAAPPDVSPKVDPLPKDRESSNEPVPQDLASATETLHAEIRDAISMIEKKSGMLFVYSFLPYEALARYTNAAEKNQSEGLVDDLISEEDLRQYQFHLALSLTGEIQMNHAKTCAIIKYSLKDIAEPKLAFNNLVPEYPDSPTKSVPGLGGDLKKMLQSAALLIEANDLERFVQNVYPLPQLARLQTPEEMEQLLARINNDSMEQAMVRDLRLAAIANVTIKGNVAIIKLPPLVFGDSSRTIKFQKVKGNWRFFDASQVERKEVVRLASKPPERLTPKGRKRTIVFRRFTRFSEWRMETPPVTMPDW